MKSSVVVMFATFSVALIVAAYHSASAQDDLGAMVEQRQQLMKTMGKSFGPIIPVLKGESTDLEAATLAAKEMNDAIVKAAEMFPAGTAKGEVDGTRAKPEIWSQSEEFSNAANTLIEVTAGLVTAGESGDIEAFRAAFQPMGPACGGCHRGKAAEGGKFRFPKD